MRARRGRGEGSICQRKDGRWIGALSVGYRQGDHKRRRHIVYGKTKREAEEKLSKLRHIVYSGTFVTPDRIALHDYLRQWMADGSAAWSGATIETYRAAVEKHIIPDLGAITLQRLEPQHIQSFYSALVKRGVGCPTIEKIHRVLHKAFEDAVRLERLSRNPVERVRRPRSQRRLREALTPEQVEALLIAAEGHRLGALFVLAAFSAMREGELFGLQWADVDFTNRAVLVKHALRKGRHGNFELGATKTERSQRRISLSRREFASLQLHRRRMMTEGHGSQFVFCTERGTPLIRSHLLRRVYYPLLKKALLPRITFHDLRHTGATLLLREGVHPKAVQERLGHSTIKTTLDLYSHTVPTLQEQAVAALDKRFAGEKERPA